MAEMAEKSEPDVVAEIYEHVAALPLERQLRVLEFVWLNAASHVRTAQVGKREWVCARARTSAGEPRAHGTGRES